MAPEVSSGVDNVADVLTEHATYEVSGRLPPWITDEDWSVADEGALDIPDRSLGQTGPWSMNVSNPPARSAGIVISHARTYDKKKDFLHREQRRSTPLDRGNWGYRKSREEWCFFFGESYKKPVIFVILEKSFFEKREKPVLLRERILYTLDKIPLSIGLI